jgi:hypothetical protein
LRPVFQVGEALGASAEKIVEGQHLMVILDQTPGQVCPDETT